MIRTLYPGSCTDLVELSTPFSLPTGYLRSAILNLWAGVAWRFTGDRLGPSESWKQRCQRMNLLSSLPAKQLKLSFRPTEFYVNLGVVILFCFPRQQLCLKQDFPASLTGSTGRSRHSSRCSWASSLGFPYTPVSIKYIIICFRLPFNVRFPSIFFRS